MVKLVAELAAQGVALKHIDLGGGLGIRYNDENPPEPADYARALLEKLDGEDTRSLRVMIEPGVRLSAMPACC